MDVLALVLACSLHFDDALVTAIIHKVTDANPLFVGDLVSLSTHDRVTTVAEAQGIVADILSHGGRPAVGLMAVPVSWAARYGRREADLYDACTNIAVGTAVLSEYAQQCSSSRHRNHRRARRLDRTRPCILRKLGADLNVSGYGEAVLQEIALQRGRLADPAVDSPPRASSIIPDSPEDALLPAPVVPNGAPTNTPLPTAQKTAIPFVPSNTRATPSASPRPIK